MNKKITILMPTYNDADTILDAVNSITAQTYKNWELIIINDGSTDSTKNIIKDIVKKYSKVIYLEQNNQDQLRAILKGSEYITGDIVMFLHSDDILSAPDSLQKIIKDFCGDAILYNLQLSDDRLTPTKIQKLRPIAKNDVTLASVMLFLGRNIYFDTFVASRRCFEEVIKAGYLTWNTPFFVNDLFNNPSLIRLTGIDDHIMTYRQHSSNYHSTRLGRLCIINGELRTLTNLMRFYHVPFYKIQFFIFRLLNKLKICYRPFFIKHPQPSPHKIIKFALDKGFPQESWQDNLYLNAVYNFYKKRQKRTIKVNLKKNETTYLGCDMREFNKKLLSNKLPKLYRDLLSEMQTGFDEIISNDPKIYDLVRFLSINPRIKLCQK